MKAKTSAATRVARQPALHGEIFIPWRETPFQSIKNTAALTARSKGGVYWLINSGVLRAVTLGGKTAVDTRSLLAFLEGAIRWSANKDRVAAAVERRLAAASSKRRRHRSRTRARPAMSGEVTT